MRSAVRIRPPRPVSPPDTLLSSLIQIEFPAGLLHFRLNRTFGMHGLDCRLFYLQGIASNASELLKSVKYDSGCSVWKLTTRFMLTPGLSPGYYETLLISSTAAEHIGRTVLCSMFRLCLSRFLQARLRVVSVCRLQLYPDSILIVWPMAD